MGLKDEELKIRSLTFEEFWTHLRNEAEGVMMDIAFEAGRLEMQWSFCDQRIKLKIVKLLQQRGARFREDHSTVYFWIEVDRHRRLNLVEA